MGCVPGWEFDEPPGRIRPSPVYVSGKTLSLLALGAQHIDAGIGTPAGLRRSGCSKVAADWGTIRSIT